MIDKYFVPKSTLVKGFEMTQELIESKGPFPDWVSERLRHGMSAEGLAIAIKQPNGCTERIPAGYFVAHEGTSNIVIYSPEVFSKKYEEKAVIDADIIEEIKSLIPRPAAPLGV